MNIAVIGTGYVGLVTGTCLAEGGNRVICVDKDEDKITLLNGGKLPLYEPGLDDLIQSNRKENRLLFTTDLEEAVQKSFLVFICVGTPSDSNGSINLSPVFEVAERVARAMNGYKIVITKSTVPVGTTQRVQEIIGGLTEHQFGVAANPEFLKEGDALNDFLKPDRIIIGTNNMRVAEIVKELYAPYVRTENPIMVMDVQSAEMTKYAANAMLATKISFMNQMANLCERLGADIEMVRKGMGADRRIGYAFIFPGVGYGGSCLPKDMKTLMQMGREHGYHLNICEAVAQVNECQKEILFEKALRHFRGNLLGKKIALWGLAFKPRTDDVREAPSIKIIGRLLQAGAHVAAYDPKVNATTRKILGDHIEYVDDCYSALPGADALALITEWNEFRNPQFERIKELMRSPVIFDGRNIYNPDKLRKMGFTYYGIGRP